MEENKSFIDPKTFLSIFIVVVGWVFWQQHMTKKYGDKQKLETTTESKVPTENIANNKKAVAIADMTQPKDDVAASVDAPAPVAESITKFSDDIWSFDISSKGMGVKNIILNQYKDRDMSLKNIGYEGGNIFSLQTYISLQPEPVAFSVEKVSDNVFVGKASLNGLAIEKRFTINSKKYLINTEIFVTGVSEALFFAGLEHSLATQFIEPKKSAIPFLPSFERNDIYVSTTEDSKHSIVNPKKDLNKTFEKVLVASMGGQYFTQAILDRSEILPNYTFDQKGFLATSKLTHKLVDRSQIFKLNLAFYAGPKSLDILSSIDKKMTNVIDFGWTGIMSVYILKLMKFFHTFLGNWGLAIILLTLLVRLLVMPFNIMSFKGMKKMQDIQPQIKALKEKYKDDQTKLNQEMMVLMRTQKVNPISSCLPMLLQFPIFIALYQVLGQSIELYQTPFAFWIKDLSLKDPYYVLPVLMGLTMYVQQKITPTTMDPAQQKIFAFLPVVFCLFMVTLPSGLTLYIFVSTLFGVIQHKLFMPTNKTA